MISYREYLQRIVLDYQITKNIIIGALSTLRYLVVALLQSVDELQTVPDRQLHSVLDVGRIVCVFWCFFLLLGFLDDHLVDEFVDGALSF